MVMKEIEQTALSTSLKPPSLWIRYVDDMYAIMDKTDIKSFHNYLNAVSMSIKFTKELKKIRTISLYGRKLTTVKRCIPCNKRG